MNEKEILTFTTEGGAEVGGSSSNEVFQNDSFSGVEIIGADSTPRVEIVDDSPPVLQQKHIVKQVVEEIGEPKEPIRVGQIMMLNGYLFKVKAVKKKDVVLRLIHRGPKSL